MDIISLLSQINDLNELKRVYEEIKKIEIATPNVSDVKPKLDFRNATTEIGKSVSYKELLEEQNYQPISYETFRKLADEIEWDESLEELLEALD
ncbi:MAG: hypothetical protein AAFP77_31235 [Bacteroidota bacterium]